MEAKVTQSGPIPNEWIVQTQYLKLNLPPEGFRCENGGILKEIQVAYEIYGVPKEDGSNIVLVCPTLTSDAHCAFYHSPDPKTVGWWDPLIGPGKYVDTNRYCVICTNILGGCKGTTGPMSINPDTGKPYGIQFPNITILDAVRVQYLFLRQLGFSHIYAVIGGSLGGMQVLEWIISYPDYMDRAIIIASGANVSPQALAFDIIAREQIESDPAWNRGNYYDQPNKPHKGLAHARQIGHVTYLSSASMKNKFGREKRVGYSQRSWLVFSTDFQVESYLHYQGEKFVQRFDANSYLYISQMMDLFDLEKKYGSLKHAMSLVQCKVLIIGISSDWLFPLEQQLDLVFALIANRKNVSFFVLESDYGHDAFLIEYDQLGPGVQAFLDGRLPEKKIEHINRLDIELIIKMLGNAKHVLDVGCGDGSLMVTLSKDYQVNGICLDRDFSMICECLKKGLNAVQLDADKALGHIEDNTFDLVIVNHTIQQLHSALQTLLHILRIGREGIVSFPNFAYYFCRWYLFLKGKLPVTRWLPFEWYHTPNIHLITVANFFELCKEYNIEIVDFYPLADDWLGELLIFCNFYNAGAERVLTKLRMGKK